MDIHFISIAATQDIYLDIWRNIKNQPSSFPYSIYCIDYLIVCPGTMIKVYFSKSLQGEKYIAVSCVKRNMLSFRFVDKSVKNKSIH